jgi:2-polyprenyl-3-methyl-5-hydroxy-6-metoxy-1,4-benzoquinol methylase
LANNFKKKDVDDKKVKIYFDKIANEFDGLYEKEGPLLTRLTSKFFRKAMFERVLMTVTESRPLQDRSILDIGCGSGRVSFLLAKEGAKVTGIDYANSMIELARNYQRQSKELNSVEFICCDFMEDFPEDKKYNTSIALGVFDYIRDPLPFLTKIKKITESKIIAFYPAKFCFQSPLRKIWLSKRKCPVFFYTQRDLKKIYSELVVKKNRIIALPQGALLPDGYIVISEVD